MNGVSVECFVMTERFDLGASITDASAIIGASHCGMWTRALRFNFLDKNGNAFKLILVDDEKSLKAKFILTYKKRLTPWSTCKYLNITRRRFENWKRDDPIFNEECALVELEITDRIKQLAYEELGLKKANVEEGKIKANSALINLFLRKDQKPAETKPFAPMRKIAGMPDGVIADLTAPETAPPATDTIQ